MDDARNSFPAASVGDQWAIHIRQLWDDDLDEVIACVFRLPSAITSDKPRAYAPQFVSLGPYHITDENVQPMERYKVAAAKKVHKGFNGRIEFDRLLSNIRKLRPHISILYGECWHIQANTLAYIMVIDSLFVFKLLCEFSSGQFNLSELVELSDPLLGNTLKKDGFLRDMLMVENQIPTFVLFNILSFESESDEFCDQAFPRILLAFCEVISPLEIKKIEDNSALSYAHVLDLLYHLIVHKELPYRQNKNIRKEVPQSDHTTTSLEDLVKSLWDAAKDLNVLQPIAKPVDLVEKLSGLPFNKLRSVTICGEAEALFAEDSFAPGAARLSNAGVRFLGAGNITNIKFEADTHIFHVPKIKLDVNSDTVLRNLLAYEAVAKPGISTFACYVKLMKGLVVSEEDVKYLKRQKVIESSETLGAGDIAEIFKGLPKSNKPTSEDYVGRAIQDANDFYYSTPMVKTRKLFMKCAFVSQKVLVVCATLLLLSLMGLQSFCSVYKCPNLYKIGTRYSCSI